MSGADEVSGSAKNFVTRTGQHFGYSYMRTCEGYLVQHIAEAYNLKLDKNMRGQYEDIRQNGMAEMPSYIALKAGLLLFAEETTVIRHADFERDPTRYESKIVQTRYGLLRCREWNYGPDHRR